ncbi:uncharacterized protein LOC133345491 isoform X2 [Lethenteron reissneri]|uniref:uncharacterized protein LOC133345491 isoform X2 n=1 Tax=Lethenteron reissneri TaxID=7753 RepID=UPI002AB6F5D1|nr:uncharacterized protein LOC133345491 isoform X2 [Lethenteron reissneri]
MDGLCRREGAGVGTASGSWFGPLATSGRASNRDPAREPPKLTHDPPWEETFDPEVSPRSQDSPLDLTREREVPKTYDRHGALDLSLKTAPWGRAAAAEGGLTAAEAGLTVPSLAAATARAQGYPAASSADASDLHTWLRTVLKKFNVHAYTYIQMHYPITVGPIPTLNRPATSD